MNLCSRLEGVAGTQPKSTALVFRGEKLSYEDLCEKVRRCAAGLSRLGVKRGDRFALMMRNCPDFVIIYYALVRLGAIAVPMNFLLRPVEAEYILRHCGAVGAATQSQFLPALEEAGRGLSDLQHIVCCDDVEDDDVIRLQDLLADSSDDPGISSCAEDVACILYTSGTTGKPKGVMLTHKNLLLSLIHI